MQVSLPLIDKRMPGSFLSARIAPCLPERCSAAANASSSGLIRPGPHRESIDGQITRFGVTQWEARFARLLPLEAGDLQSSPCPDLVPPPELAGRPLMRVIHERHWVRARANPRSVRTQP